MRLIFPKRLPSKTDMCSKVEVTKMQNGKIYKCQKCFLTSKRRYNVERHYQRFHEKMSLKICCGTTFCFKSDFYKHREEVHDEKKKYTRRQDQEIFIEAEQQDAVNDEISERVLETQNNEISLPKKLQMKSSRAPLTNIENVISRRNAMKSNSTPRKIVETNFSSTKENIEIYNITDHSMKGIDKGLHSIKF